jgi:hypothetical protein
MSQINLDRTGPERLLDEWDPRELVAAMEAMDKWTPRRLALINDVFAAWVSDFIARPNDREGLVALQSAIHRTLQSKASQAAKMLLPDEKTSTDYARRWEAYSDAIAARYATMAEREPDRVRSLTHVAEIEKLVSESGEIKQSELKEKLSIANSRLSQVLALMEAHGLIERRSAGREKYISIAAQATSHAPSAPQPPGKLERFASQFSGKDAA